MLASIHMDPLLPSLVGGMTAMLLVGLVLRRLRQPHVLAYLLGGLLLGPFGLDLFPDEKLVARLGEFGVVLLLFFLGMEVSVPRLAQNWRVAVIGTLLQVLVCVGCIFVLGGWLDWPLPRTVMVGFAISLSSTAVVVSILRQRDLLDTERGRDALGILLAQDMLLIPMLVLLGVLAGDTPNAWEISGQVVGGLAMLAVLTVVARSTRLRLPFAALLRFDHELQIFGAFLLCFGFAWFTGLLGLSTAMGAFVAGVVVAAARETDWVHHSLEPFRVIFVAAFFMSVGMLIDLEFMADHAVLVGGLALATLIGNTIINAGILSLLGRRASTSLIVGAMLAQAGEFSFVLAMVGRTSGMLTEFGHQVILALIVVTLALSPAWIALVERLAGGLKPLPGDSTPAAESPGAPAG